MRFTWVIPLLLMAGCSSCREARIDASVEETLASADARAAQVELLQTGSDKLEPITPMTRVLITKEGLSVDNATTIDSWWRTGPRIESRVLDSWSIDELIVDYPLVVELDGWKFDPEDLRQGEGGLNVQPLYRPLRGSNTVESRIVRDLGREWSSGDLSIWAVADAPYRVLASAIYMALQQGYSRIFMALQSPTGVVGLPMSVPRFAKDISGSCRVALTGGTAPELDDECDKVIVEVDWPVTWQEISPVLQDVVENGKGSPSLAPLVNDKTGY